MSFRLGLISLFGVILIIVSCQKQSSDLHFADLRPFWWNAPPIILFQDETNKSIKRLEFQTGKEAKNQVVAGNVDFGVVAATPLVLSAIANEPISIMGQYLEGNGLVSLISSKGQELVEPVGIVKGTVSEFVFLKLAEQAGKKPENINIVYLSPVGVRDGLLSGQLKSGILWDPLVQQVEKKKPRLISNRLQDLYKMRFYLIGSKKKLNGKSDKIDNFLKKFILATVKAQKSKGQIIVDKYVAERQQPKGNWLANRVNFEFIDARTEEGWKVISKNLEKEAAILRASGFNFKKPNFESMRPN